jgi:TonB-linked SusC/RagA family outer membrane protein
MEISISGQGPAYAVHKLLTRQLLRIMKLTALFLIIACIQVSARSYSQTISFSGKNVPLQAVFASIEKQTGVSFFFNYALLKGTRAVSLEVHDATIDAVLDDVLSGQGLSYYQQGKTIFILKKQEAPRTDAANDRTPPAKQIDVKGRVLNHEGLPMEGATVIVKHTTKGVVTDSKGMFEIKNAPPDGVLEISYAGYQHKEVAIEGKEMVTIEMALANNTLDETQVIAYGTTTQRMNTGDVTTIKTETIEKQPIDNPLLALEGQVPGLFITQNSGVAGAGISVLIQGQNSIARGNDPFFVIDGVPYTSQLLPNYGSGVLGFSSNTTNSFNAGGGNPFSFINPADIESITVLKDADATAIYGSRAANGAILITTKKGRPGDSKVDFNIQNGWGRVAGKFDLLNLKEYLQMRQEALRNDGIAPPAATDYDINGFWDTTRSTDWQKVLIGNTAQYSNFAGTVSGGTPLTQYLIGATYHRENSVFPGSNADNKGAIHFNINSASSNQNFKLQLSGSFLVDKNKLPNTDLTSFALRLSPDAPKLYNADGTFNWQPNAAGSSTWQNPLAFATENYQVSTNNFIGNGILSYIVIPGLEIKSSFGYNYLQANDIVAYPLTSYAPEYRLNGVRTAHYSNNNLNSWIVEPQISYKRTLGRGRLEVLAGTTIEQNNSNGVQFVGTGYSSDDELQNIQAAALISVQFSVNSIYKYNAGFGRLTYNFDDKYIINLTGRRDGSSRFGSKNEFHDFEAVGGAWLFSNENFIKNNFNFLSFGKVRASYGTTGNDEIGDYQFLNLYTNSNPGVPYQNVVGLNPNGLPNPYLQWEETKKLELGLEIGFFKDRIYAEGDYFRNRSSNELLPYKLPIITGFNSIFRNFPATVQNSGWEISIKSVNIKSRDFTWSTSFNLTIPRNKLLAFPNLAQSSYATSLIVGQPVSIQKYYHFLGVNPSDGEYLFSDSHGNATSSPNAPADMTVVLNQNPAYYGGFENDLGYKGFNLGFIFQFVKRRGPNGYFGNSLQPGAVGYNQPTTVTKRWQRPGDITSIQRYNSNYSLYYGDAYATQSDASVTDASFIRLKNVSLSWTLSRQWQKSVHLQNAKIFVNAQNLLTITKYVGLDPETLSLTSIPPLRIVTFGLQAAF